MQFKIPPWGITLGAALVIVGLYGAVQVAQWAGERDQQAKQAIAQARADSARADSLRVVVDSLLAREDSLQARLRARATRIAVLHDSAAHTATDLIERIRVMVPDSVKVKIDSLESQVDTMKARFADMEATKDSIIDSQMRQIVSLMSMVEQERSAKLSALGALEEARLALNPPWYTELAAGIPEAGVKLGAGALLYALTPADERPYAVGGYALGIGTDLLF